MSECPPLPVGIAGNHANGEPFYKVCPDITNLACTLDREYGRGTAGVNRQETNAVNDLHAQKLTPFGRSCRQNCLPSGMRENILFRPSGQIELGAIRQELETGLRHRRAAFPRQHGVEPGLQRMQMKNIGRRIGNLRLA